MYNIDALERGIKDIRKNIAVLNETVAKEEKRIEEYEGMIVVLQRKAREAELINSGAS